MKPEYCITCGEPVAYTEFGVMTDYEAGWFETRWLKHQLAYCSNVSCPRYGLVTMIVEDDAELAKRFRDAFAKKKE